MALAAVKQEHRDDDESVDDLASSFRDLHHRKNGLKEGDQDHTGDRAEKGAASPKDTGAPDHLAVTAGECPFPATTTFAPRSLKNSSRYLLASS